MPPLLDLTSPQLLAILRGRGLDAGMEALNANVAHRYTGIFRVDGPRLFNVHVYDKLGQARPEALAVVELADSFCQFVLRDGELLTANSLHEDKLVQSPFRGVVVAYHGVPIGDNAGGLWGTLCHFDYEERELTSAQYELLKAAGHMLYPFVRRLHGGRVPETAPGAQAPSASPLPLPSVS